MKKVVKNVGAAAVKKYKRTARGKSARVQNIFPPCFSSVDDRQPTTRPDTANNKSVENLRGAGKSVRESALTRVFDAIQRVLNWEKMRLRV